MNEKELSTFWKRIKLRRKNNGKNKTTQIFLFLFVSKKNHVLNITIKYYYIGKIFNICFFIRFFIKNLILNFNSIF